MDTQTRTGTLLEVIERRLAEISERQHALAVEKACLVEQMTPLRLGVASPDLILAQLRAKGIALSGTAPAWVADRRHPQQVVLKAVVPKRTKVTRLRSSGSETA